MLITAGIVGFVLPGPGTPAIIAGGLALWPGAFGKLESWLDALTPDCTARASSRSIVFSKTWKNVIPTPHNFEVIALQSRGDAP